MSYPSPYEPVPRVGTAPRPARKKSNAGIWIGLSTILAGVLAFVAMILVAFWAGANALEFHTIDQQATLELSEGRWRIGSDSGVPFNDVSITNSDGRELSIDPYRPSIQTNGDEPNPTNSIGNVTIPTTGQYTVDVGSGSVIMDRIDIGNSVTALGLGTFSFFVGGFIVFVGIVITIVALIVRFA